MRAETVTRSYAETLFDLALRHEGLDAYAESAAYMSRLLEEDPEVRTFLETPRISTADKKAVMRKALEGAVPQDFLNFVLVVIDKRRQRLLLPIFREFAALTDEHLGRMHVEVTLARPLPEGADQELTDEVSRLVGRKAIPHVRIKPAILGGIIVRAGDTIYDGSLQRRLASMRKRLLSASLPEAQGGA